VRGLLAFGPRARHGQRQGLSLPDLQLEFEPHGYQEAGHLEGADGQVRVICHVIHDALGG